MESPIVQTISYSDSPRNALRSKIFLRVARSDKVHARTLSVSSSGLTIMSPRQFRKGMVCEIVFDLLYAGQPTSIQATSRTGDCVCVGLEGFRTYLQFVTLDESSRTMIKNWMHYQA